MSFPHGRVMTTVTSLQSQLLLVLTLAVLLCPSGLVTVQGENQTQSPAQVLQDLLSRYGDNSTITVPQLRALLALLSKDPGEGHSESSSVAETPTSPPPKANRSKVRTKRLPYLQLALWVDVVPSCWFKRSKLNQCQCSNSISQQHLYNISAWEQFTFVTVQQKSKSSSVLSGRNGSYWFQIVDIFSISHILKFQHGCLSCVSLICVGDFRSLELRQMLINPGLNRASVTCVFVSPTFWSGSE